MSAQYRPYRDEESVDGLEATSWSDNEPGTIQIYEKTTEELPFNAANKRALYIQLASFFTIGLLGFLLGYFAAFHPSPSDQHQSQIMSNDGLALSNDFLEDVTMKEKLLATINGHSIRDILETYKDTNRIPGSETDLKFAKHIQSLFESYGMDRVTSDNYTFQTMLPKKATVIKLLDKNGKILYSNLEEDQYKYDDMRPFLPLSQANESLIITDQLLFVNRGTKEDFLKLNNLGLGSNETDDKVLVIRQGYYQAHDIVIHAQESGARAILLFPDPEIYSEQSPFPRSVQLPNDAGRSQPTAWNNYGDLAYFNISSLTGIDSSKLGIEKDPKVKIPVIPISFNTAKTLLRGLSGSLAPLEWNCFNFTLYVGPKYKEDSIIDSREKISIEFYNQEQQIESTTVTGMIVGSVEPDRYIVLGSRRDSLNRGLLDSVSGSAVMLELARAFGLLKKQGWHPRRTIIFNSFGAESLNLIGSSNWLQEHQRLLHARAIAFINCDLVVTGNNNIAIAASPLLYQVLYNATRQVENPNIMYETQQETVYDSWKKAQLTRKKISNYSEEVHDNEALHKILKSYYANDTIFSKSSTSADDDGEDSIGTPGRFLIEYRKSAITKSRPRVRKLDLQSIYSPFFLYAGIPVVDVRYAGFREAANKSSTILEDTIPILGTKYDNMATIQQIDPSLKYHITVTKVLGEILRDLSDSVFLPFNILDYAITLNDSYSHFVSKHGEMFNRSKVELDSLKEIIQEFADAALKFHYRQDNTDIRDAMKVRKINDQLMMLERDFLDPSNVPNYMEKKHIILSPNDGKEHNEGFPGLVDWITLLEGDTLDSADYDIFVEILKINYKVVVYAISNAIKIIDEVYVL